MRYVIKKVGFFRHVWHLILTYVFKIEVTVYEKHEGAKRDSWLKPFFLCPGCGKYQDWEYGCADDYPEICDACWDERREKCDPSRA